jgi:hypothetical protein
VKKNGKNPEKEILFLLAEVARRNFRGREEQRHAVTVAYLALAGRVKLTKRESAAIEGELER